MPRKLGIDVDDMHIALRCISNDGFIVLSRCDVGFDIDAESTVEFELQSVVHIRTRYFAPICRALPSCRAHCCCRGSAAVAEAEMRE